MTEGNTFKVNDRRFSSLQAAQRYAKDHHEHDIEEYEMIIGKEKYVKTHSIVEAVSLSKVKARPDKWCDPVTFLNTGGRESPADAMGPNFTRDEEANGKINMDKTAGSCGCPGRHRFNNGQR